MLPGERRVEVWGKKIYISELLETIQKEQEEHYGRMKSTYDNIAEMFQEKTNNKTKEMSDRIKLEDMTLKQIQELKDKLRQDVDNAVVRILTEFEDKYGIAADVSNVWTERDVYETEQGDELAHQYISHATIHLYGEEI